MKKYLLLIFLILPIFVFFLTGRVDAQETCDNGQSVGAQWPECHGCDEGLVTCNGGSNYGWESVVNPSANCGAGCVGGGGTTNQCDNGQAVGAVWPECRGCDEGEVTCNGGNNYSFRSVRNPSPNCGAGCGGGGTPPPQTPAPSGVKGTLACKTTLTPSELRIGDCRVCDRLHEYRLVTPSGGASDCSPVNNNSCKTNADCPPNTSQPNFISPGGTDPTKPSNWCYGFIDGARCLQLWYKGKADGSDPSCGPTDTPAGSLCTGGSCSSTVTSKTQLSPACASCIDTNNPGLANTIKGLNTSLFTGCTNQQLLSYWCDSGISAQATAQCNTLKTGVCASACGGSGGGGGGGTTTITTAPACISPASSASVSPTNVTFSWGSVSGAQVYDFRVWDYNLGGWNDSNWLRESIVVNDLTSTSYSGSGGRLLKNDYGSPINLPAGQNYRYRVSARNSSSIGPWADCNFAITSSITPTPTPTSPPVTTVSYRITSDLADFQDPNKGWKDYNTEPLAESLTLPTADQTPGDKTVWVEFKDSTGKIERRSAQIKILGDAPAVANCSVSFEGNNTVLNLTGTNFGENKGTIKSSETDLTSKVRVWKNNNVQIVWSDAPTGQVIPVSLTNVDGQIGEGACGAISQLALGAKVFCRAPSSQDTDNVDLTLAGVSEGSNLMRQKVKIDKNGVVLGLNQKLQATQQYNLSLKAPKGLRKTVTFTAGDGTTNLSNFILPIGDIAPVDAGDGTINAVDKAELNRQWIISSDATGRSGDFNRDSRVNSIDWACMRYDFGCSDDPEAVVGQMSFNPSCPSTSTNPKPSPSPGVSPSPSPSPSISPSP